ncbi:MAG: 6,7-dimethyl-8-ribityllumazine synthase [Alphaproteobacteria bacterium]|nr:6,7-dimethyl-8-ribityllumazine synthase [Alphaproteobacteria bacterium]
MTKVAPKILIVEARYYPDISDALLAGALSVLKAAGAEAQTITVPGALEIPGAIAMASAPGHSAGRTYDGFVALGCVIRGETTHYEIVSNESARGLMELTLTQRLAIGNGILTVENEEQAWARVHSGKIEHKGENAAKAALAMIDVRQQLGFGHR